MKGVDERDGWKTTFDTQIRASTDRGARTKFHLGRDEWRGYERRGKGWRAVGEGIFECSALETMYRVTHCSYSHRSSSVIFRYPPLFFPPLRPALHLSPLHASPGQPPSPTLRGGLSPSPSLSLFLFLSTLPLQRADWLGFVSCLVNEKM